MEKTATKPLPEQVRQQLQRILLQDDFKRSPVLSKFLEFIVLTKLAAREDEIKEYTIGVKALGRPVDFNPQLDAVVRIHASRLRIILTQFYQGAGKHDPVLISVPKGSYVPHFEARLENITPGHQLQPEKRFPEKPVPVQRTYFVKPVLAVLPFHDLSAEQSNDRFLTALGEQLSSELSKFDNLSVISFYATRNMDATVKHLKELKSEGIEYILTGSLRHLNGTIRLNMQLMMVDSGNILWSDSLLTHPSPQIHAMDIQDEIIWQVANAIADEPKMVSTLNRSRQLSSTTEKNVIQEAISQYFDYIYDYNSKKFEATMRVIELAHDSAPDNAFIISILAKLYLDQFACAVEQDENLLNRGISLSEQAVAMEPRSQWAQKALAWGYILSGNKQMVAEAVKRCIALNPSAASCLGTMGLGLIMLGEYDKGNELLSRSLRLRQQPFTCTKLGLCLYHFHHKNFAESNKWLTLLSPFDIPFSSLLNIAIEGNLNKAVPMPDQTVLQIKGRETSIVDRIVLDPELREEIRKGWRLAGFVPQAYEK